MKCVVCKSGETRPGTTTVTFERDGFTLVMKEVPAEICTNCGEDYVDEAVARDILALAEKMAKTGSKIEVIKYGSGSVVFSSPSTSGKFEVYVDKSGRYRFRLKASNGKIIAVSEPYNTKTACLNGIDSVKKNAANAIVKQMKITS